MLGLPTIILLFAADRLAKYFARQDLVPYSVNHKLLFVNTDQKVIIIACSIIIFSLFFLIKKVRQDRLLFIAGTAIILGGLSNLYDRIFLGFVIDYLPFFSFSEFNLADVLVYFGCFLIIIKIIKDKKNIRTETH